MARLLHNTESMEAVVDGRSARQRQRDVQEEEHQQPNEDAHAHILPAGAAGERIEEQSWDGLTLPWALRWRMGKELGVLQ